MFLEKTFMSKKTCLVAKFKGVKIQKLLLSVNSDKFKINFTVQISC